MKHLLAIGDLTPEEVAGLLEEAAARKAEWQANPLAQQNLLPGQVLSMIFEKPSLRTRISFEVGMVHLGGRALYISPLEVGLRTRESVADVARVLGRMCQGIMARVFAHSTVRELAAHAGVPVINGLSDWEHPCQALADLLTLKELRGLQGRTLAYVGDGNNVCHSLLLGCAFLGVTCRIATPPGYEPDTGVVDQARAYGEVTVTDDPHEAVQGVDAIYTDVWTSMGQEEESARRREVFPPFQVNANLLRGAASDCIVLHCLPAHRGDEITDEVMDGPQASVFQQAENRLHAQKAVLLQLLRAA